MSNANPSQQSIASDRNLPTRDDRGSFVDPLAGMIRRIANVVWGPLLRDRSQFGPILGNGNRRFHVYKLLGRGGQGEVYAAWDRRMNRFVALKLFNPPLDSSIIQDQKHTTGHGTLRQEALLAAVASGSPGVIVVYELMDQDPVLPYMVMEYAAGGQLKNRTAECRRSVQDLIGWLRDVATALVPLHYAKCIHGDIKPENILLLPRVPSAPDIPESAGKAPNLPYEYVFSPNGVVAKLADFGLAGRTGHLQGFTPGFTDPQVIAGGKPSHLSDVFSLGATACWLLLGHAPGPLSPGDKYRQPTEAELCRVPGVTKDLAAVIRKATAEHDSDRYEAAHALLHDLDKLLHDETPLIARPLSLISWHLRRARKNPLGAAFIAIMIVLFIYNLLGFIQSLIMFIQLYWRK